MEIVITADSNDSGDRDRAEDVAIGYARMFGIELQKKAIGGGGHACQNHKQLVGGIGGQMTGDHRDRQHAELPFKTENQYDDKLDMLPFQVGLIRQEAVKPDWSAEQAPSTIIAGETGAKPGDTLIVTSVSNRSLTVVPTEEVTLLPGQELVEVNGVKMAVYPAGYIPPTPEPLDTAAIFGDQTAPVTVAVPPPPIAATTPPPALAPALTTNVAPPAPLVSAPQENVTALNPVSGVDVDKDGVPWDARIHSEKKTKNADGTWRLKRSVDKEVVALVKEELKGLLGTPIAAKPDTPPPVIPPVVEQPAIGAFPAFTRELAPHMRSVTNPDGKLTPEYLNELAKYLGVVNSQGDGMFSMLIHRPDAIPLMRAEIVKAIGEL